MSMVTFTLRPLYSWERDPRQQMCLRLSGPKGNSERSGEKTNTLSPPGIEARSIPKEPIL